MRFSNIRLRNKLAFAFGAVLTITAISSSVIFFQTRRLAETERLNSTSDDAVDLLDKAAGGVKGVRASTLKFVMTGSEQDAPAIGADIASIGQHLTGLKATRTGRNSCRSTPAASRPSTPSST